MSADRERERDRDRDRDRDGEKKGPPNVDGLYTLKVDNISFKTTAEILREEFKVFGSLGDVYLPRNYSTNEPRGFAFVRFVNREDGEDALRSMDGKLFDGRELRIQEAKERRAENPKEHMVNFVSDEILIDFSSS
jgi:splicing factor, arginine/serine-rich 2